MEESKSDDKGEQLLLLDTAHLQLDEPDMEQVHHDRMDRNRHLMTVSVEYCCFINHTSLCNTHFGGLMAVIINLQPFHMDLC